MVDHESTTADRTAGYVIMWYGFVKYRIWETICVNFENTACKHFTSNPPTITNFSLPVRKKHTLFNHCHFFIRLYTNILTNEWRCRENVLPQVRPEPTYLSDIYIRNENYVPNGAK